MPENSDYNHFSTLIDCDKRRHSLSDVKHCHVPDSDTVGQI